MIKKILIFFFLILSLPAYAQNSDYIINGGEVLRITVYNNPDLNSVVRVSQTGKITFSLLGNVELKGLTAHQVEMKINEALLSGNIVVNPQVNVFIEQFKAREVAVIGEVVRPGKYELKIDEPTYLTDIISTSEGITDNAGENIIIIRKAEKQQEKIRIVVNISRLFTTGDLSLNRELQQGDILHVPRAPFFYIYGEINRPNTYRIEPDFSLSKAISIAGGYTADASTNAIEIIRQKEEGEETVFKVNLKNLRQKEEKYFVNSDKTDDMTIQENDVIYIPSKPFFYIYGEVNRPGQYMSETGLSLIQAISIAGGYTERASTNGVKIVRKNGNKEKIIKLELNNLIYPEDDFFSDGDMSHNIKILAEDIIHIPKSTSFYVYGEVNRPGVYNFENRLTVIKALSIAGGTTDNASTGNIKVIRKNGTKEETIKIGMNRLIRSEDVIIVPESLF